MSSKVTITQSKGVRAIGLITIIIGALMILVGATAYWQVSSQLSAERITVSDDADFLAGKRVTGPFSAYAQAAVINKHALEGSGNKTYAELDREDPQREVMMNASFLRASLFTSVVAFGVSVLAAVLGLVLVLLGWSLRRISVGPSVVVENFDGPTPRHAATPDEAEVAPEAAVAEEIPPPTRVARRAASPVDDAEEAPPVRRSGSDVAETLSRHSRGTDNTAVLSPVTGEEPVASPVVPAEPGEATLGEAASASRPSFDEVVAEPAGGEAEAIPVPPRQSWQSPADRAPVDGAEPVQDDESK